MARRPTAAQLREKRARTLAIAFSAVFLIVMIVQVPKLMKAMHGGGVPAGGHVAGALPAGVNPDLAGATKTIRSGTVVAAGHLGNLSRFALKDPFRALIKDSSGLPGAGGASGGSPSPKSTPKQPAQPKAKKTSPAATAAAVAPTVTFTATKTPPNAAVVKTNGRRQIIFVGDAFPAADPLFKLVALGKKNIRIGVLGGSFTSGAPTIKLVKGKRLTLANEADGSHYMVELVRFTTATPPAQPAAGSSSAPAATTTTTTPATTTPAVTTTTTAAG
jgi:hypothetical protein